MQRVLTARTNKEQPVMRAIVFAGQPTARAALAGVGRLHLHTEGPSQRRFVGKCAVWSAREYRSAPPGQSERGDAFPQCACSGHG
jgi:hypothetical protein